MDQAQKLLKAQQPAVLKDPFPQGQNSASASNVAGAPKLPLTQTISTWLDLRLCCRQGTKIMRLTPSEKGKAIGETSNPLTIDKPAKTMSKIPKGVFKKTLHNPNARASSNYSVVEELAQTHCAMLALEVLQSCPAQRDALLAALGSMESSSLMEKFHLSNVKFASLTM